MTTYARITNNTVQEVIDFDPAGRFTSEIAAMFTPVPNGTKAMDKLNIDGTWTVYVPPVAPPAPAPINPTQWLIDIGPFYDRFGAAKMAVLTSVDPAVVAIRADVAIRKWIDLTRTDVAQSLGYIGTKVPTLTAILQASILTNPVVPEENLALRKLYFS